MPAVSLKAERHELTHPLLASTRTAVAVQCRCDGHSVLSAASALLTAFFFFSCKFALVTLCICDVFCSLLAIHLRARTEASSSFSLAQREARKGGGGGPPCCLHGVCLSFSLLLFLLPTQAHAFPLPSPGLRSVVSCFILPWKRESWAGFCV